MVVSSDEGIRMALGMNHAGMCCRHPNQPIYRGKGEHNNNNGSGKGHHSEHLVQICRICDSESLAGGVRQRKSFAVIIGQVQNLHANKEEWDGFKKNWVTPGTIEESKEEEKKDTSAAAMIPSLGPSVSQELARAASIATNGNVRPIDVDDLTRQLTLRLTQVQDWMLKEREKEIEVTKLDNDTSVSELHERIHSMQLIIDGQNEKLLKLQQKAEKQQKTINQELRMIKMIALKRATQAGGGSSPEPVPGQQKQGVPNSDSNRRGSSGVLLHTSTESMEFTLQEAPPRRPERKRSEFDPGLGSPAKSDSAKAVPSSSLKFIKEIPHEKQQYQLHELVPQQEVEVQEVEIVGTTKLSGIQEDAPRLPIRQTSQQAGSVDPTAQDQRLRHPKRQAVAGRLQTTAPSTSAQRKVSLNNEENFSQPLVPLRVHVPANGGSGTDDGTGPSGWIGVDLQDTLSAITSSVIDDIAFSDVMSSGPILLSGNTPTSSNGGARPMPQPGLTGPSHREMRNLIQPGNKQYSTSLNDEVLFVPQEGNEDECSEGEIILRPLGLASPVAPSKFHQSMDISFMPFEPDDIPAPPPPPPSREIDFDASREFSFTPNLVQRKNTVADMSFDSSQQLLVDASKALSETTPMSVQHKTIRSGRASKKVLAGSSNGGGVESSNRMSIMESSTAQEYAANLDSLLNQPKSVTPISTKRKGGAPQEFAIHLNPSLVKEEPEGEEELERPVEDSDVHANSEFDEDDYFNPADFPPGLPLDEQRYLTCTRSDENQSPFSDFSEGSYLLDEELNALSGDMDEEGEDDNEPRKGLGGGVTKQLPLEADLDFDSESDDDKSKSKHNTRKENKVVDDDQSDGTGNVPARHQSIMRSPKLLSATSTILRAAAFKGASAEGDEISGKPTYHVEQETVQDKYGDGGEYSGSVSLADTLPHGFGIMKYDNDRQYEGDWSDGRW
jgi:hypothetical protein